MSHNEKAVIFARVSTALQFQKASPDDQERICNDLATAKGLTVVKTVNVPESGYKGRRHFNDMLKQIKEEHVGHLITLNLERLTRDMQGFLNVHKMVTEDGLLVHLVQTNEVISKDSTKNEKCRWMMEVVFSEWTIAGQKEKARRSLEGRLERGGWPFVKAPYGYDLDHDQLTPNDEAPLMAKAFTLIATGTDENVRTVHEKLRPEGLKLSQIGLYQALHGQVYIGEIAWPWPDSKYVATKHVKGEILKGNWTPIVSVAVFNRVQETLSKRSRSHPFKSTRKFFLYRGLLRCECGRVMSGAMFNGSVRYQPNHTSAKHCGVRSVPSKAVDRAVEMVLSHLSIPKVEMRPMLEKAFSLQHKTVRGDRAKAQAEFDKAQKALNVAFSKAVRETFDAETFNQGVAELKARRDRAKETLDRLAVVGKQDKEQFVADGLALFKVLNNLGSSYWAKPERRHILLRRLFKEIQVKADKTIRVVVEDECAPLFRIKNSIEQAAGENSNPMEYFIFPPFCC